jgi:hypothetical protein
MATLIVVRRDASQTFQHVQATLAQKLAGDLAVIWDRRTGESSRSCSRRRSAPAPPSSQRPSASPGPSRASMGRWSSPATPSPG